MTTSENETLPEGTGPAARKPYESPVLREWGSILELTAGGGFDVNDGDFTGSGAT
ncbi:MAG TPA: lasso RiPP family leader peptide-containing protein [Thermoanaerobaculia bacterium]